MTGRLLLVFWLLAMAAENIWAEASTTNSLEQLLEQVRKDRQARSRQDQQRIDEFRQRRDQQQQLLAEAKAAFAKEQERHQQLIQTVQVNAEQLQIAQEKLATKAGKLGEIFGLVRQVAAETEAVIGSSLISAQRPGRTELLRRLAEAKGLPSLEELEGLWVLLLEEMTDSATVTRFSAPVIGANGEERVRQVTRVGPFNAVADGSYLRYLPETGRLMEMARQPTPRFQHMAQALEQADEGRVRMAVDPSRGAILSLMVQTPTLKERLQQGGIIGYVILAVGAVGLLVVLERALVLLFTGRRMQRQLRRDQIFNDNPLGRLLHAAEERAELTAGSLARRLEEVVLTELPRLRRGLPLLAVLAGVAPLLGLLGTVTGMIHTFQSITLFGTGDPKIMSGGISEALITTELGLGVAIPLVLLHGFLSGRSNRLVQMLDEQSAALVALRAEQHESVE